MTASKTSLSLSDGRQIPIIALGTFKASPSEVGSALSFALDCGYTHFDLAYVYKNEESIGAVLSERFASKKISRESLFITNKLPCSYHRPHKAHGVLAKQLASCQLDYFDLYLVHWPMAFKDDGTDDAIPTDKNTGKVLVDHEADLSETWRAMIEMKRAGKVKSIGVSNFNEQQLQKLLNEFPNDPPVVNQVEIHPYNPNWDLVKFCQDNNIVVEAYAPLGARDRNWLKPTDPDILLDEIIVDLAKNLSISPAQLLIKWIIQRNIVVVVKSCAQSRINANLQVLDLPSLPQETMDKIAQITKRFRYYQIDAFLNHPNYPFPIQEQ